MRVLDLFSGTGSVADVFRSHGHTVTTLDRDMPASINIDIMQWQYRQLPNNYFDVIWASPPCTEYSRAKTTGIRKLDEANAIVRRTLDIIAYFNPSTWILENPQSGLLKNQVFMVGLPYVDVDYCKYGMPYRKRTRLWTNRNLKLLPLCNYDCDSVDKSGKRHKATAQRLPPGKSNTWDGQAKHTQQDLYRIPAALISDVIAEIECLSV